MAKLIRNNHLVDINLVIPESQVKTLAKYKHLLGPLIGATLLAVTASMHLAGTQQVANLEQRVSSVTSAIAELTGASEEDLVTQFRDLRNERDELTPLVESWQGALPTPPDWPDYYSLVLEHLPGIGGFSPDITLRTLNASNSPTQDRAQYGLSIPDYQRLFAEFSISGTAKTKEDVTQAALAFQESEAHAVIFTGTSTSGDGYSFNLTVGLLEPLEDETPGGEDGGGVS